MHKKILQIIVVIFVLAIGIFIGWLHERPKEDYMHGKLYEISPRYSLTVWFHETGFVRNVCITDKISGQLVLDDIFYENGFLRGFQRKTIEGLIEEGFRPDGTLHLRKYYKGDFLDRTKYYDEGGELKKTESFPYELENK